MISCRRIYVEQTVHDRCVVSRPSLHADYHYTRASGSDAWLDRVALKTGTLTEPISVNSMAGYLRKKNGGWMAFAVLVNGSQTRRVIPFGTAIDAIRGDLEAILKRY